MVETELVRVQLTLSEGVTRVVDRIAKERRMSRSEFIEWICWQYHAVQQTAEDLEIEPEPKRRSRGRPAKE